MVKATAIGYHSYSPELPTSDDMIRSYGILEHIVDGLGLKPTYFSAWDGESRGGWKKYGGAFHQKVINRRTGGFYSVGLAVNPLGSKEPGYDSFLEINFRFSPDEERTSVYAVIHEPYLDFASAAYDALVEELAQLWRWDYGFAFERDASKAPMTYLVGGISRTETPEEKRRVEVWYAAYQPEERRKRVRDIFPYNMIGLGHLKNVLPDGRTLEAFINADGDSELRSLTSDLWLWKVVPDRTEAVRAKLRGTGIVISE
jgi:hypothetical protein